ncbi:TPA: DUF1642 domain-containing protein, partial [Streptococcus agalactiae]
MNIEEAKLGQTVYVKGIITDIDKKEIFDLEIHTSENDFFVNSDDVFLKLDQPKPVVPQIIFDIIKKFKDENRSFYSLLENISAVKETWEWLNTPKAGAKESDLMQAWLAYPNITVQKEKL